MTNMNASKDAGWNFDQSYSRLPNLLYKPTEPSKVKAPSIVILNKPLAKSLGLNPDLLNSEEGAAILAGNILPEGALPIAQAYAGHQFGHFNMLGDGRAILLGEQLTPDGERLDIQLKGAGRTPFSRGGDGRAALGPMLREYIISEAMHGLGIATTRSLGVVATGEPVYRESVLPGAVLTRVADSHLRVGTFQFVRNWGSIEDLRALADYTLIRHYADVEQDEGRYLNLLKKVVEQQASLIAKWQLVGFIHGVMNTDNMALSGITIDYGPCAFMDTYDTATVFSSIDREGRYAYGNQPQIGAWNLARFAETLLPLLHEDEAAAVKMAEETLSEYFSLFHQNWLSGLRSKLGIFNEEPEDEALIAELLEMMQEHQADYTNTFRALTLNQLAGQVMFDTQEYKEWHSKWQKRLERQEESKNETQALMKRNNPAVIPRNHRVEEALEAAVEDEDLSVMEQLLEVLADPYAYSKEQEEYAILPPKDCAYQTFCGT
ncbi:YdiU family protein [Paenibacillus urinalis]|uniref:Protein nucleotidyltransferase YdiU n=1 Tax=Paenibacillus urinalis TaxID=521520 RepID=A0AAX3MSX2_9BACL|nr:MULTISPECIES: YdiU family protein [Paenibacillus]WDH80458.1 YdiU family protein [Paenibacillus urinalis]WDH96499.1 YdiU family protein [Paenibacillus urinalis]WDI00143.1 YdiU family protein [Paenibacillus urinalis]